MNVIQLTLHWCCILVTGWHHELQAMETGADVYLFTDLINLQKHLICLSTTFQMRYLGVFLNCYNLSITLAIIVTDSPEPYFQCHLIFWFDKTQFMVPVCHLNQNTQTMRGRTPTEKTQLHHKRFKVLVMKVDMQVGGVKIKHLLKSFLGSWQPRPQRMPFFKGWRLALFTRRWDFLW